MEQTNSKKTVRTYACASFLNDLGSDMIYPIWPLFVTSLGANMTVLGLLDGLGEAIVSISQAISGYIADRIRRRRVFVWLGYLCGSRSRRGVNTPFYLSLILTGAAFTMLFFVKESNTINQGVRKS